MKANLIGFFGMQWKATKYVLFVNYLSILIDWWLVYIKIIPCHIDVATFGKAVT